MEEALPHRIEFSPPSPPIAGLAPWFRDALEGWARRKRPKAPESVRSRPCRRRVAVGLSHADRTAAPRRPAPARGRLTGQR